MLRPETHKSIAEQAEYLAGVASGEGEYGLANSLWAFEAKHRRLIEESYAALATDLRAGKSVRLDEPLLHALRKRQLIDRSEFEQHRAAIQGP